MRLFFAHENDFSWNIPLLIPLRFLEKEQYLAKFAFVGYIILALLQKIASLETESWFNIVTDLTDEEGEGEVCVAVFFVFRKSWNRQTRKIEIPRNCRYTHAEQKEHLSYSMTFSIVI